MICIYCSTITIYLADCLSCSDLSRSLEVKSNLTGRNYSSINIKSQEIHCKVTNYIYLLTIQNCGVEYIGESITLINLRMNIHRKSKCGCEHFINHYKNIYKSVNFSIQILEKLKGDGFLNGQQNFALQELRLLREDYWMNKLCTICPYGLSQRAKSSNLEQPTSKFFPPLPRFGNWRENLERRRVSEPTKFNTTETLLAHIATIPPKNRSDNFRITLIGVKGKDLRKLVSNTTDEFKTCDGTNKK